jgi:hypothetical protein
MHQSPTGSGNRPNIEYDGKNERTSGPHPITSGANIRAYGPSIGPCPLCPTAAKNESDRVTDYDMLVSAALAVVDAFQPPETAGIR